MDIPRPPSLRFILGIFGRSAQKRFFGSETTRPPH
jgi:hypothetical protein